ncbi:hypothetical protein BC832DRAFT_99266 [Gaertneriomyces semiglobifer]|nr:hypothetical protein BC832DRAFT_99266 [Gaertneriomyces semiglobifer]
MQFTLVLQFLALVSYATAYPATARFNPRTVVAFGDSLSDTGNSFKGTQGADPPAPLYFQGRYSNGPVWVEHFAKTLGLRLDSRAFGGSGVDSIMAPTEAPFGEKRPALPGLLQQVASFLGRPLGAVPPNTLITVWSGSNDYFRQRADITPQMVVDRTAASLAMLIARGYNNLVVWNLPASPAIPDAEHNALLAKAVASLRAANRNVKILEMDANKVLADAVAARFAATGGNINLDVTAGCVDKFANPPKTCDDPAKFITFDGIHPEAKVHELIGAAPVAAAKALFGLR